ncbi:Uncharacterised protein [Neisseria meningitidis]|nr:Uncharacterised protein [Neisseria meningitidis]CWQ75709.1 Uncharacterised protein [Neisseria meningitidis]CWT24174.1 Uncharacterised protein [Neisseria meningitidis]
MGGHNRRHTFAAHNVEGGEVGGFEFGQAAPVFRQDQMAVSFDKSVSGKMFAAGFHTAFCQTFLKGEGEVGDRFGIVVETAVADDGAVSPVQI